MDAEHGLQRMLSPVSLPCAVFFLEDPILQEPLEGYQEYTYRVPYKLIPHVR